MIKIAKHCLLTLIVVFLINLSFGQDYRPARDYDDNRDTYRNGYQEGYRPVDRRDTYGDHVIVPVQNATRPSTTRPLPPGHPVVVPPGHPRVSGTVSAYRNRDWRQDDFQSWEELKKKRRIANYINLVKGSEPRVYSSRYGDKLPYRLFYPDNYSPRQRYPLIIFLHGMGERGNDNLRQMTHAQVLMLVSGRNRVENPAFLIAPQCPDGQTWAGRPSSKGPARITAPMANLFDVVDGLKREFSIDQSRIYLTGISMGGFGVCDYVARRGYEVAAYIPICGGADNVAIARYRDVPSWFFHGDRDPAVPVDLSRSAVMTLRRAGASVRYTEFRGAGHDIWTQVYYNDDLDSWMYSQRKDMRRRYDHRGHQSNYGPQYKPGPYSPAPQRPGNERDERREQIRDAIDIIHSAVRDIRDSQDGRYGY